MKNCFDFDYNNSILSLSNSLLKYYGIRPFHPTLKILDAKLLAQDHKNIVFMILDGMSVDNIKHHLPRDSFISSHIISPIYSVFPPTTTAATTSFHTGLSPLESGWIGWTSYYKEYNRVIENFLNTDYYTGEALTTPKPGDSILAYKTIYSRITEQNPNVEYHQVFPPFTPNGAKTFDEMCTRIVQISKQNQNKKIISAYWPEPDHSMHHFGVLSDEAHKMVQDIEANLQKMYAQVEDAFIIISADHGLIDIEQIWLNDYPELCAMLERPLSLEARFVSFCIKDDKKEMFVQKFNQFLGNDFKLYSKEEFLSSGLLGAGTPHAKIDDFIGDFVAIALGNKTLHYTTGDSEGISLVAEHAGISESEMIVPLIIAEKD